EIFHLSQTYLAGEGPVLPVPSPALSEAEGVVEGSPVEGPVDVLQGFSLQVKPGEFVSILDPTPVGQVANLSYLLSLIGGLSRPTRGAVYLDGQEVWHLPAWKRSRLRQEKISFLFREPKLLPHLNVLENVLVALEPSLHSPFSILRPSWWEKRRRAREVLAQVGLGDRLHCRPGELTPAEQQRVALARALAANPALILADEPTEGLDADETRRFVALLREQCRHHDPSPALRRGSPRLPLRLRSGQGSGKAGQGPGHGLAFVLATQDSEVAQAADRMVELPVRRACPERSRRVANLPSTPFWERQSAGDFLSELYEAELGDLSRPLARIFDLVVRPLLFTLAVAAVIAYLCFFGLRMAGRGQAGLSGEVWRVAGESAVDASRYLAQVAQGDLGIYHRPVRSWYWIQEEIPVAEMLGRSLDKSLVLLCVAVALGGLIGVPLGIGAALVRRSHLSLVFLVLSIAGVSIPSFFMAFLLQILEVQLCRRMDLCLVPLGGFGWDRHIVLPALVLAARPIAQVASVSFATLTEVLDADYVRTARAKGLSARLVLIRHALPNAGVPILTALGTSLRFSLSSLPVVEVIFTWPGLGMLLLQAIQQYQVETATAAILCLGLFFIAINMGLERVYRVVNPRLREEQKRLTRGRSWLESLSGAWYSLQEVPDRLAEWLPWGKPTANQEEREKPVLSVA
ncbi:MAG: ABC transporter permease subunit, partial [Anaerolineae bacterium]|nr:ABC transporter permease subunit [Anaerolineae bacterium]